MHFHQDFFLFFFFFFERGICLLAPFKLAPRQSYCTAVFEEQLGLSSSPQSPITGTQQSLRCAGRQSDTDSNTCTHTSTYAPFHLLHQPEEAEPLIPNQLRLHFLHLSALFGTHTNRSVHICTQEYTHTQSTTETSAEEEVKRHTSSERNFLFFPPSHSENSWGSRGQKKFLLFVIFEEFLQLWEQSGIWARGVR